MLGSLGRYRTVLVVVLALFAGSLVSLALYEPASGAPTVPAGFQDSEFAAGLNGPTAMEFAPDGRTPVSAYKHDQLMHTPPASSGCAITAGTFYHAPAGASVPFSDEYTGDYFFADFCNGWIRKLDADSESVSGLASGASRPVDLKVGPDGGLYYLELGSGSVRVIRPDTGG